MNRYLLVGCLMIIPLYGLSKATEELVRSMVPRGNVSTKSGTDFSIRTQAGTKISIEFARNGEFDEASGLNLGKGDIFEPGDGLISLGTAAQVAEKKGRKVRGQWRLEKDSQLGWIYEMEAEPFDDSVNYYIVDAKKAQLINSTE